MTYESPDEVPEDEIAALVDGVALAARKLRQWRAFGDFHEIRVQWLNADGVMTLTCHEDDTLTFKDGETTVDATPLLDG